MSWSRPLATLLLTSPFLAAGAGAEKGDYILGAGVSVDDADGIAATVMADVGIATQTWLSASIGRNSVELPRPRSLDTWYGDIAIDHYWDPAGVSFGLAYWGDSEILDSIDIVGAIYRRGAQGTITLGAEYRDFKLDLPPVDAQLRTEIPFHATGLGLSGRLKLNDRANLRIAGMSYEYNINLRIEDERRIGDLLSISRLSLLSSLVDWRVSAGIDVDFGLQRWQLDVATWRGAIDGGDNQSITVTFLTPFSNRTDVEIGVGYDESDLYGEVAVLNLFLYFYGGD